MLDLHIKRAVRRAGRQAADHQPAAHRAGEVSRRGTLPVLPGNEAVAAERAGCGASGRRRQAISGRRQTRGQRTGQRPRSPRNRARDPRRPAPTSPLPSISWPPPSRRSSSTGRTRPRGERGRLAVTALSNLAIAAGPRRPAGLRRRARRTARARATWALLPDTLPGHLPVGDAAVRDRLGKLWGVQPPAEPGLSYEQMIGGGVRALYVMGANPAADRRDRRGAAAARLPGRAGSVPDRDGAAGRRRAACDQLRRGGRHLHQPGTPRPARAAGHQLRRREPRRLGRSWPRWPRRWQTAQAHRRLRGSEAAQVSDAKTADWKRKKQKAKAGPAPKPWNYPTAGTVLEEIGKAVPAYAGIRWETLGERGLQWPASALARPAAPRRAGRDRSRSRRRPRAATCWSSSPVLWDGGTLMQHGAEQVRKRMAAPFVALNPADLAAAGLIEGPIVTVTSSRAQRGAAAAGRCLGAARHGLDSIGPDRRARGDARRRPRRTGAGDLQVASCNGRLTAGVI